MKKLSILVLIGLTLALACKKHTDKPATVVTPTLADTLRAACTSPFEGHGDSSQVYLPTAFTPNGDGLNDVYRPIGVGLTSSYFSSITLKIYDTSATLVYQSTGTAIPVWDGIDQNTHVKSTKYMFYVQIKYTTAGHITDSGSTYLYLLSGTTCVNAVAADTSKYRFSDQFEQSYGYTPDWSSMETYCH